MQITIDESVEEAVENTDISNCSNFYWKSINPKRGWITREALQNAHSGGLNCLEIVVSNILNPLKVEFILEFKKRKPHLPSNIVVVSDGVTVSSFTSIAQSILQYGPATTFRFRYPIQKLLNAQTDWFYTLGKEAENVFLLLYHTGHGHTLIQGPGGHTDPSGGPTTSPGPTVSRGVKIPKGRV